MRSATLTLQRRGQLAHRLFRPPLLGDVLNGAESAPQHVLVVELELGFLPHPLQRVTDDDAVLDVVRLPAEGRRPLLVNVLPVVRVNGSEKHFIRHRGSLGQPEDPIGLVGPEQHVAPNIQRQLPV